jgi:menaquinone-dependent protoporphyrinogen IX oxidase
MIKTAIVYKTIYGSTGKYANWLKTSLKADLYEMDAVKIDELKGYKQIIVMSGTYAGQMPLTGFLKKNWDRLENKELVIVAVGAAPEDNWWSKLSYWLIPKKIRSKAKYFKLYGRFKDQGPQVKRENLQRVIDYLKK